MTSTPRQAVFAAAFAALLFTTHAASAATYEVGEGQTLTAIGDVPWESLMPGDLVRIHWRAAPYNEKWVIARRGTEADPIVVQGVRGPGGERPVIDGRNATTRSALNFWSESRGVIKIGGASTPDEQGAAWIVIEGLDIRSGRAPYTFTGRNGQAAYSNNAASIFLEAGENIVIRDCVIRDSANGLFIAASDGRSKSIKIERNHIYDNGVEGSIYEHNSYTAAIDIVFEGNHYGPLRDGCGGNNLKDRSAGLVVRYNWIESGNRQLDLVDAEDSAVVVNHPRYNETFVYGNVIVEHEGDGNSQMVHYGGDSGTEADYRKGTLYFYNNTLVSTRSGNTTMLRLSTDSETADVRNNIVYNTAGGRQLSVMTQQGTLNLSHNCMPAGWVDSHDSVAGTVVDDGTGTDATTPRFQDLASSDYRLAADSPCIDKATDLALGASAANPLSHQYIAHQRIEPRPADGTLDIGAYEHCSGTACSAPDPDAGPQPTDDAGTGDGDDAGPGNGSDAGPGGGVASDAVGGCGCHTTGGGTTTALLAGLLLAMLFVRRRASLSTRQRAPSPTLPPAA